MLPTLANPLSIALFIALLFPVTYWFTLAIASVKSGKHVELMPQPTNRFIVAIPAHNESSVIANTVERLMRLNYPNDLFQVHVVADYCSDTTVSVAQQAGAIVHERNSGARTGKGAALTWLLSRVLKDPFETDAVVIFDADTVVDDDFLRVMDSRLRKGSLVIQGQHIISNPEAGWFPSLTWAMFIIDNRYQNLGRVNLGWSAKNMGDSICFEADVLRQLGWGEGLTEDYQFRQKLMLSGVKIEYEPAAKGYGEAPRRWGQAQSQRARWLRGTSDASRQYSRLLFLQGIRQREGALLDGALQARFPSFSTLSLISMTALISQLFANQAFAEPFTTPVVVLWAVIAFLLFLYPFFGLLLERAPVRAYAVILTGPFFIIWRTGLAIKSRVSRKPVAWVRTAHGEQS